MPEALRGRILVVDDHAEMCALLCEQLSDAGFGVTSASDGAAAIARLPGDRPDVVITDLRMAGVDGMDVLAAAREADPDLPVIVMTAYGVVESAVEAMRAGAWHYVTKPFRLAEMLLEVERALAARALRDENRVLRRVISEGKAPAGMAGTSRVMRELYSRVARLADVDVPVLIRGESGTGKERVGRALHDQGTRSKRAFVAVNCAALPGHLLESELFGHVKGAFTGATTNRRGLFVEADGGTLFLDEIGDMPLELQGHLLRVLQERAVRAVGSDVDKKVDVRVVAATHQDLEARIREGTFRADLYYRYRLDVVPLAVPPLRERVEDIPALIDTFLARERKTGGSAIEAFAPDALAALARHTWPGNVRELENLVRRVCVLAAGPVVSLAELKEVATVVAKPEEASGAESGAAFTEIVPLRRFEDRYIAWVIDQCGGNKTRAADLLGIDVSTIHRREKAG
jgi:two-component system, NtrC family, response regulator HydG